LIEKYGVDAVRYYLIKELSFGQDGTYSEEIMVNRINSDLANDLGNLISRTIAMIIKYFDSIIPSAGAVEEVDEDLQKVALTVYQEATEKLERLDFSGYLYAVSRLIARANKYIDETEPWALARKDDQKQRLATVMYNLAESIRIALVLTAPAMPTLIERANRQLGIFNHNTAPVWEEAGRWGLTAAGTRVSRGPALFPRIDTKTLEGNEMSNEAQTVDSKPAGEAVPGDKREEFIGIEDFARMDLRVAQVIACEKMEKADKLLVLRLKVGDEERTVVSGIAKHYAPMT
jgi:methionyl-tRNA synthetase